jgi:hypothetical protein
MDMIVANAHSVNLINSNMIKKNDLDQNTNETAMFWTFAPKNELLSNDGIFGNYWVITKNTTGSNSTYELYCGNKITSSRVPSMIFNYENNVFKGILVGDVIRQLILIGQNGILSWEKKIHSSAYIHVGGGAMLGVAPGTRIQHINHITGRVTEVQNQFSPLANISGFQRGGSTPSMQDRMMQAMNTPGISLGAIGANLHRIHFG